MPADAPATIKPRRWVLTNALLAFAVWLATPVAAQTALQGIDGRIEQLEPGDYLWAPQIAPEGPVMVIISLTTQRLYAYRNGVPIGVSTVSSGKPGHATPTGLFTILQKDRDHESNLYSDAPMPFMQRLTWSGIALHAGDLPGYPASHGCVRMPAAFAKLLYGVTKLGLTVVITNEALAPEVSPQPALLDADASAGPATSESYEWRPEASSSGPLSIVVSGREQRLIVLRNGVQIGASHVRIYEPVTDTIAFTLRSIDDQGYHWLRLPLPGDAPADAGELTATDRGRVHIPEAFRLAVASALQPGATLLVTRDSLRSSGTGDRLTVLTSEPE